MPALPAAPPPPEVIVALCTKYGDRVRLAELSKSPGLESPRDKPNLDDIVGTLEPDDPSIAEVLNDDSIPRNSRASVAMHIGYNEGAIEHWQSAGHKVAMANRSAGAFDQAGRDAAARKETAAATATTAAASEARAEAPPPAAATAVTTAAASAPTLVYNDKFLGKWVQDTMEADKLEAILKVQKQPWVVRQIALSIKLDMAFSIDDDGDMLYVSKTIGGTTKLKCVNGANVSLKVPGGMTMNLAVEWKDGHLVMYQENVSGGKINKATITQKYDAERDLIVSENDSVEGFYIRTFKRVRK